MSENAGIDLFEAMSTLRAVRRLRKDPVPDDVLRKVLTAATWAPSGGNRQEWRFLAVTDAEAKRVLRELYHPIFARYAKGYDAALEKMAEPQRTRTKRMVDSAMHLAERFDEAPVIVVVCTMVQSLAITDANLDRPCIVGGASIYPAVQNLMLACRAVGLGATLTTLLCGEEPKIQQLLGIPKEWATAAYVPIGYPEGKGFGPVARKPVEEVAFRDRWGRPL